MQLKGEFKNLNIDIGQDNEEKEEDKILNQTDQIFEESEMM